MNNITEIIPDDMPAWMRESFDNGSFFRDAIERNELLVASIEGAANMMRGMQLDPSIPAAAKDAMSTKIKELDSIASDYSE